MVEVFIQSILTFEITLNHHIFIQKKIVIYVVGTKWLNYQDWLRDEKHFAISV